MIKKIFVFSVLFLNFFVIFNIKSKKIYASDTSLASNDAESALYGLSIDKSLWDVRWNNYIKEFKTTWNDAVYGLTDIHVGEAFYKEKINNQYWTCMIFAIKTMPKNTYRQVQHHFLWNKWDEDVLQYGVLSYVNVKCDINESSASLIDSSPKYVANSTSYSISSSTSVGTSGVDVGISGGVSFSENAIDITNNTNSSNKVVDIKVSRNNKADNAQAKKQMAQENWWYFRYDALTDNKYLKQKMTFELQYQMLEDLPEKNPNIWRTSRSTFILSFV